MREVNSLNHTRSECKYHIVFIPKYRMKVVIGQVRKEMGEVFYRLARQKESLIEKGQSNAGLRAYDDIDTPEICCVSGDRIYQREECDPSAPGERGSSSRSNATDVADPFRGIKEPPSPFMPLRAAHKTKAPALPGDIYSCRRPHSTMLKWRNPREHLKNIQRHVLLLSTLNTKSPTISSPLARSSTSFRL